MQERRYLLNIEQLLEDTGGEALFCDALDRIDGTRRQKVSRLGNARARAAGAGAGLLIQKALTDHMTECRTALGTGRRTGDPEEPRTAMRTGNPEELGTEQRAGDSGAEEDPILECFSVEELLSVLDRQATEPCYRYGKNGKPYLADYPFQFNLSHSGDYVFCGVSEQEIGVDIQKIQGDNMLRLAKRFFAGPECQALEACGDADLCRRMFFRMWTRKEAYGKLTGEGIPGTVGKCLWRDAPVGKGSSVCSPEEGLWRENGLLWEEYDVPCGYRMAVCRFCQEKVPEQLLTDRAETVYCFNTGHFS